jgi:hypothetical protein
MQMLSNMIMAVQYNSPYFWFSEERAQQPEERLPKPHPRPTGDGGAPAGVRQIILFAGNATDHDLCGNVFEILVKTVAPPPKKKNK